MHNILYIVWNERNNIGIPIIDEQHRGIISTINSFYYDLKLGLGHKVIRPTLVMVQQSCQIHFRTEETLMKAAEYPDLEKHIKLHRILIEQANRLAVEAEKSLDFDIVLNFLKQWWLSHINMKDREYAPYVLKFLGE